jgi:outer membrane biosynthesis protein TonB
MDYREENNYPKAFALTTLIMGLLIAMCFFIIIANPPKEDVGMGGILVNYGTSDQGSGSDFTSVEEVSQAEKTSRTKPDHITDSQTDPSVANSSDQKVVTQNSEDAPEISDKSKKPSTDVASTPQNAKPQKVNQAALFKGMKNNGTGQGDGTTGTPGNQGSANGSPLSDNYGPGGSGNGLNLPHWDFISTPDVKNTHRVPGKVVIDFTIDAHGNVIEAHSNRNKTQASLDLIQNCEAAIKASKFRSSTQATGNQNGEMTFIFKVD